MPVFNPETKENDFVDLNLVDKISIDPQFLTDLVKDKKNKITFSLDSDKSSEEVILYAKNNDINMDINTRLSLQQFEEILFDALNKVKSQRIEDTPEFKTTVFNLINPFIEKSYKENIHLAMTDVDYCLDKGIGIIRDMKTNQEIATFETLNYFISKSSPSSLTIRDIILYGRTMDELEQIDRYEYAYYSLTRGYIYSFLNTNRSRIEIVDNNISFNNFQLVTEKFDSDHRYYDTVNKAQEQKQEADKSSSDILSELESDKFRASRLQILEESNAKQKQEKLEKQFSDIEFDF
ncbi:hypothetical protein KC480_05850 [Bacillus velezensis]|uniref:hypothetical protein n=1 Tax=Bacillus velezensis TaxID=492670 RepID=UPI001E56501B|nr:hypothetical protein [Bacillus velezensis]MCD7911048.1 hypothetical protein [Bacillus velezensis]